MQRVVHTMQQIARHEVGALWTSALGVVTSVHGANGNPFYACTVELRESGLVLPKVPVTTGLMGVVALPDVGDLVLIVFLGGDIHAPVVAGRLYSEKVAPPKHGPGELVAWLPRSEEASDQRVELTVKTPGDGTRRVHLVLDGDVVVEVDIDDGQIKLSAQDASLTLSQSGSSDGKAQLKVGDSSVVLEQSGDVTITASGTLKIEAAQVEIAGDTSVKVTGQTIDLN